ncbi:MAG: bpX6 domain-containing protein [Polyangiaceae bacterium]
MKGPLRHPIHRGSVVANGVYFDVAVLGEEESRRRALGLWSATSEVHRCGDRLVLLFSEPVRLHTSETPGGLLVRQGDLLSSAPLDKDEIAAWNDGSPSVFFWAGGAGIKHPVGVPTRTDPSTWIDVTDWQIEQRPSPLGRVHVAPAKAITPIDTDVRGSLGVGEAAPGAEDARAALIAALGGEAPHGRSAMSREPRLGRDDRGDGGGGVGTGALTGLLGALLSGIASVLSALFPMRRVADDSGAPDSGGAGGRRVARRGSGARRGASQLMLPESSPFEAFTRGLRTLAARLLAWSRLSRLVGRKQAEYLSRMLEMFDRGDLDEALRHAISLGEEGKPPGGPALGGLAPREDLAISPHRGSAKTSLFGTPDLFDELRRRYRKAFEDLESRGEIDKAAFVLAELLHAHEEAVSFLERHGRYRLAAEIAEARDLPAGLVVRQWFLAKDPARAVAIARARGAFAEAIQRLDGSGHKAEAESLTILFADHLATIGDYSAAVETIWPVVRARPLAREWLDRAIAIGGVAAGRAAIHKVRLVPESFPEVRDVVLGLLGEPEEEDVLAIARALTPQLLHADPPQTGKDARPRTSALHDEGARALAKPIVRSLLRSRDPDDRSTIKQLLKKTGDAALLADLQRPRARETRADKGRVRVAAHSFTEHGKRRHHNEDAVFVATLAKMSGDGSKLHANDDAGRNGLLLLVVDGMGGSASGDVASVITRDAVYEGLREGAPDLPEAEAIARLRKAIALANQRLLDAQRTNIALTGCGATFVAATIAGDSLLIAHAGDSRAYLYRGDALTPLTRDHSLARMYTDQGLQLPAEVLNLKHQNIVTCALGMKPTMEPDIASVPLCDNDVLLLCTDGLWKDVDDDDLLGIFSRGGPPEALCARIARTWREADANDDAAVVVAHVRTARSAGDSSVDITTIDATGVPAEAWTAEDGDGEKPVSLAEMRSPIEIRIHPDDAGALPIFDAAELPDGRFLVALGEAGSRLISRTGRTLARFSEPAHRIVISDHGDRALVLATRGEAQRIARIDIAGKREQAWCDARLDLFAETFDGSIWYVVRGRTLSAIDAIDTGWSALWSYPHDADILSIARSRSTLACLVNGRKGRHPCGVIRFSTKTHRREASSGAQLSSEEEGTTTYTLAVTPSGTVAKLVLDADRARGLRIHTPTLERFTVDAAISPESTNRFALDDHWIVVASGTRLSESAASPPKSPVIHVVAVGARAERLRVDLGGRGRRCGARIQQDHLVVFDDRGRLLVISLRTGKRLRDLRLS